MKKFLLIALILLGCASNLSMQQEIAQRPSKNVIYCQTKKEGFEMMRLFRFQLTKIDSVCKGKDKIYIFKYKPNKEF